MSERTRNAIAIAISVAAAGVILIAFVGQPDAAPTAEDRVAALSAAIKCPFCNTPDFDKIGLKHHFEMGWCEVYEKVERL